MKIRVCDLSAFVDEKGDISDYLSLPGKNRDTFISEVLDKAKVGRPFSDVPDFIRQQTLSDAFLPLHPRDQHLYFIIEIRAARFRVTTGEINGMKVRMQPGEYITSVAKIAGISGYTEKEIRISLERLTKAEFIRKKDLKLRRGSIITLVGWADGQTKGLTDFGEMGKQRYSHFSTEPLSNSTRNGQTEIPRKGIGFGQLNKYSSGMEDEDLKDNDLVQGDGKSGEDVEVQSSPVSPVVRCGNCRFLEGDHCRAGARPYYARVQRHCSSFAPESANHEIETTAPAA